MNKSLGRVKGEVLVAPPKTENSIRTVVIPQQAVDLLVEDRKNHPDSKYLFPSPHTGEMWSPDAVGRLHKKILRAAGIDERVRFHDLRHPYVKHTTQKYNSEKQKTQATKMDLIAWVFRFCIFNYSKRSWIL